MRYLYQPRLAITNTTIECTYRHLLAGRGADIHKAADPGAPLEVPVAPGRLADKTLPWGHTGSGQTLGHTPGGKGRVT